jgi:hypothetical protein
VLVRDLPLPEGAWASAELNLLAWALVGAWAGGLDGYVAIEEADGKQPDLTRNGLTHIIKKSAGQVIGEYWQVIRTDGSSRHYDALPAGDLSGFDRYEVELDVDQAWASARYRTILGSLSPYMSPDQREIMTNPILATDRARLRTECAVLQDASRMVAERYLEPIGREGESALHHLDGASSDLHRHMIEQRERLSIDANEASALLLAADLAAAASASEAGWRAGTYGEYIARAADELATGRWDNIGRAVSQALGSGHGDALGRIADAHYEAAKRRRDFAMDAPAEPLEFTRRLFNAAPYAATTANLSKWAAQVAGAPREWVKRKTETEELFVRLSTALSHQWLSWASGAQGSIPAERLLVEEAQRQGDDAEVRRLILDGEYALRRPRSYRAFLLGERPLDATIWQELLPQREASV